MCVSAEASYAAGSVLVAAGAYCLWETARRDRRFLPLATLPLIFGVQQFAEGAVWQAIGSGSVRPGSVPVQVYLFFALAFWPVWLPLCMAWILPRRWPVMAAFGVLGLWVGWSLYFPVASDPERFLSVSVRHHSILYDFTSIPVLQVFSELGMRAFYAVTIVGPLLLGDRGLKVFGAVVFLSMVVTQLLFAYAFASVWCLMAALLSAYLVYYVRGLPSLGHLGGPAGSSVLVAKP